ncbi:hypothetical protein Tco_1138632 [Tanacetum coccineum]
MHSIIMTMRPIQVNTKFINHLQPEWSKFVTDVKLAKDLNHTNFDQLYAYLRQHEAHADEVRIMKERFPNPLALVANTYNSSPSYSNQTQYHQQISPFASEQQVLPIAPQQLYDVPMIQQHSSQTPVANHYSVVHRQSYQAPDVYQPSQASFPLLDSGLVVSSFLPSDDPISSLNKAIAFIITTFTSRYPPTNNQLRTSSNPRNQATIQDGRVQVQTVQGRQNQGYAGSGSRSNATATGKKKCGYWEWYDPEIDHDWYMMHLYEMYIILNHNHRNLLHNEVNRQARIEELESKLFKNGAQLRRCEAS